MRRLNVKLALWLVGITVFSVVGVHFLHGYQLDRNADFLKVQAETALKAGDVQEAIKQYNQYLKHRDDPQGYSALAELVVGLAKDADATRQTKIRAYNILEEAIRRHPDLDDVRERLIEYTMQMRRYPETLEHIEYLKAKDKTNPALDLKVAICHYAGGDEAKAYQELCTMMGFDPAKEEFAEKAPASASEVGAFELAGQIVRKRPDGVKTADLLMKKLVEWNPDSVKAHLVRANFLLSTAENIKSPEFLEAKKEIDRAYELDPNDGDAIMSVGSYAATSADDDLAMEMFTKAQKLFPKRQDVYLRLSQFKVAKGDVKGAAEDLKTGIAQADEAHALLERLIEIQFQLGDLAGAKETYTLMQNRGIFVPELLRFEQARIDFAENHFLEASKEFEAIRPALARFTTTTYAQQLDLMLGKCYEILGQPDRQLEVYRQVLQNYPDQLGARLGETMALQNLGRFEEAETSLRLLVSRAEHLPQFQNAILQMAVSDQLSKPLDKRNWKDVDQIASFMYQDKSRKDVDNALLKADLFMMRGDNAEATKILTAARKQDPKDARVWVALARLLSRDGKADKLPQLLNLAEKELGDTPAMRVERIRSVVQNGGEDASAKLAKLEEGLDKFTQIERTTLMMQFAGAYSQLRNLAAAKRCWRYAADQDQKSAGTRQYLFEISADSKDLDGMAAVVKEIHDSPNFGPNSPLYKYCKASQNVTKVTLAHQDKPGALTPADRELINEARKLVEEGLAKRGEWNVLWRVRGELDQLEGNLDGAITSYQRSLSYSRSGQGATARRLVQLLAATRRWSEANDVLKILGPTTSSDPMAKLIQDIKIRSGESSEALAQAKQAADDHPQSSDDQLWLAQMYERLGQTTEAEDAYRNAVKADPKRADSWELLVIRLMNNKKKDAAQQVVAEAETALADNPIALARLYLKSENNAKAEELLQADLQKNPEDLTALRRCAEFYFLAGQRDKALTYVEQMLAQSEKAKEKQDRIHIGWARRCKAEALAASRDYEHVIQATQLIEKNTQEGELMGDDMLAVFMLLADRPEPESRARAAKILETIRASRPLQPREEVALAQLYSRSGKWPAARELYLSAATKRADDPEVLLAIAQALAQHEEYEDSMRWLDTLDELIAKATVPLPDTIRKPARALRARLLAHDGKTDQAEAILEELLPRPLPPNQLYLLDQVARTMEEFKLYDGAER